MVVRLFSPADYPAVAAVHSAALPDDPRTAEEVRFSDEHRDPRCLAQRWVAEDGGQVVGFAGYDQSAILYHPRKFLLHGAVRPGHQFRGIGSALYDRLRAALVSADPISLRVQEVAEDRAPTIHFLQTRGFREVFRAWELLLNLQSARGAAPVESGSAMQTQGLEIHTLRELESDSARDAKLYDLVREVQADEPTPEPVNLPSYEHFVNNMLAAPELIPDAFFVAVSRSSGEYAGLSFLWSTPDAALVRGGLTGVRRQYRRRGLAFALKLRTIEFARSHGHSQISTSNAAPNQAMLALNERLGFVKQRAFIDFVLEPGDATA